MREEHSPRRHHDNNNLENTLIELLPNQLYFGCFQNPDYIDRSDKSIKKAHFVNIHNKFHYEPFYEDFGPWNLSVLYRLCVQTDKLLEIEEKRDRRLVLYCQDDGSGQYDKIRVNTAYFLGAYLIIYHGFSADDAYLKVSSGETVKFIGFRDASMGAPQYLLHVHDVLRGIEKALKLGWLGFSDFDYEEYEFYERVENGDFNWIIPGKVLSFCGPHNVSREENGYPYHAPEVYFDYFRAKNVSTIVRLNAKNYDASKFTKAGFEHVDLFFVDGSTPSDEILLKFIKVLDNAKGGVAVHCKAGLGRTGTLIACWMMKEFGLTAGECMGWLRVCRPGSVIGPQQVFLVEKQKYCWSLSDSNVVHLTQSVEEKRSVRRLANKVDDINLSEDKIHSTRSRENARPNILRRKVHVQNANSSSSVTVAPSTSESKRPSRAAARSVDETALDDQGRSQGDRLLQLKAKHQHEAGQATASPTSRRFAKNDTTQMAVPSQAYLSRNREPYLMTTSRNVVSLPGSSSRQSKTSLSGHIAYRTRNALGNNSSTLTRTGNESYRFHNSLLYEPSSAVFPSIASRRSEATRYLSPTTPIKPMSPAYPDKNGSRYKSKLVPDMPATAYSHQPQTPKCTLSAESKSPKRILTMPSSKSASSLKKIQVSRPRPYPSNGVRVELCANGSKYDIRPRKEVHTIPGAGLAANTEALLGKRKKPSM